MILGESELLRQMGERIFQKRKAMKLTQEQLAEQVGVSIQMISNLECGKKAIRPENLIKICHALGISADYVLTGSKANTEIDEIINKLSSLTPEELQMVSTMIDYMRSRNDK